MSLQMAPEKAKRYINRLESIINAVRLQNSGADIHTVGNIRNTAQMLKESLQQDPSYFSEEVVERMLTNTERSLVSFFERKYLFR